MVYLWSPRAEQKEFSATDVKKEIMKAASTIEDAAGAAERAVIFAKNNPDSNLYKMLEWDDSVAGHRYRVLQVARIIRDIIVIRDGAVQTIEAARPDIFESKPEQLPIPVEREEVYKTSVQSAVITSLMEDIARVQRKIKLLKTTIQSSKPLKQELNCLRYDISQVIGKEV